MLVILCFSVLQAQNAMLTNQSDILVQDTKPGSELGFSGKWVLGAGINMIEDSGQQEFVDFFTLKHKNWGNPFYISTEYLYNSQFSLGATFRFNKYQSGKTIQGLTIQEASEPQYFAIDFAAKLFLREILQRHAFTPYVAAGTGYRYIGGYEAENQLILADIGHFESERYTKNYIVDYLIKKITNFAIILSEENTNPVKYF